MISQGNVSFCFYCPLRRETVDGGNAPYICVTRASPQRRTLVKDPQNACKRCCLMRGCIMLGSCGALKAVLCGHSLLSCHDWVGSGSRSCPWNQVRLLDPFRCPITRMYQFTWMASDMRGLVGVCSVRLMAARPHDRLGRRMRGACQSSRRPKCTEERGQSIRSVSFDIP
jgi:hypothetical protein